MRITVTIVTSFLLFGGIIGCSEINKSHPDSTVEKCEACHYLPPRDSGKALGDNPIMIGVHQYHVVEKNYSCDVCHQEFDKVSGTWMLLPDHNADMVKYDSTNCLKCHSYLNCNNPNCHSTPPGNAAVVSNVKQPILKKIHDSHMMLIDSVTGDTSGLYPCQYCHKGFDYYNMKTPLDLPEYHDNGKVDVEFDLPFPNDPISLPSYDNATGTCSYIYCHGTTIPGGKKNVSVMSTFDTVGNAECNACHDTLKLASMVEEHARIDHAEDFSDCLNCHDGYLLKTASIDSSRHINGTVDLNNCANCHTDYIPDPFTMNPDGSVFRKP